jgi:hypothetical protein
VHAAVEDVEHRDREKVGLLSTEIAVQRQLGRCRGGAGDSQAHRQDGVGTQPPLVRLTVQIDQCPIDFRLLRATANEQLGDRSDDVRHCPADALSAKPPLVAVAQLEGLVRAGRSPGGHNRPA